MYIQLFIEVLKEAFDGLGSKKLDREEWFLEDRDNGHILDLKSPWLSHMRVSVLSPR